MKSSVITFLSQIVELNATESELIETSFTPIKLEKGSFFLEAGEINRHVGFLEKGLIRYFVYKDGEESTFEFTKEGEFIADYESFNNNTVSIQNIQAIEECELMIIDYPSVQHIFKNTLNGNLIGRLIIEHRFDVMVNQLLCKIMKSATEVLYRNILICHNGYHNT